MASWGRARLVEMLRWWPVALVVAIFALVSARTISADGFWQARTGLDVLRTHTLPHADTYSWTAPGKAWVPNSWGWDLLLGVASRMWGLAGMRTLTALFTAVVLATVAGLAKRRGAGRRATALVLLTAGVLLPQWLTSRPQLVTYLCVLLLVPLARRATRGPARQRWWAVGQVGLVHLVWVNLHFAAMVGPVVVAAAVLGCRLEDGPAAQRATSLGTASQGAPSPSRAGRGVGSSRLWQLWTWSGAAAVLAGLAGCLLTPYGLAAPWKVVVVADSSAGVIAEWESPGFGSSTAVSALLLLVFGLLGLAAAWRLRSYSTVGALVVLAAGSVEAARFAPMLALVAAAPLAVWLSRQGRTWLGRCARWPVAALAVLVVSVGAVSAAGAVTNWTKPDGEARLVQELPSGCRLLNDYTIGGEVSYLRPDVRVAVDGRNDLYGAGLVRQVDRTLRGTRLGLSWVEHRPVDCALVLRTAPLSHQLLTQPGWRLVDETGTRSLLVKDSPTVRSGARATTR